MGVISTMTVVEHLSEEEVVVGPDGIIVVLQAIDILSDVRCLRNDTVGIEEVTVGIAVLHVGEPREVGAVLAFLLHQYRIAFLISTVDEVVVGLRLGAQLGRIVVVIALVQIVTVQVVGHLTVVECLLRHLSAAVTGGIGVRLRVVAVEHLRAAILGRRIAEDGLDAIGRRACCHHPAVGHIALARVCHAGRGERARDTEVIDIAAEVAEQRVIQTADDMTVAMERALEALARVAGYRRPGRAAMVEVGMEDEVEILSTLHRLVLMREIQWHVTVERSAADGLRMTLGIVVDDIGQVDDVLQ